MKKNHVILVNPAFQLKDDTTIRIKNAADFPLGLGLLATIIRKQGYSAEIVNASIHEDWEGRVMQSVQDREDLCFVGFSCMSSQIRSAIRLSKEIKSVNPQISIVYGGVHPTLLPESLVKTPWVDFSVIGEGDAVVVPLIEHLNGRLELQSVPNLCTRENGCITRTQAIQRNGFDKLPDRIDDCFYRDDIDHYIFKARVNGSEHKGFSILTGLGCNYTCAFCINHITKRRYRSRSADSIYREIKHLHHKYGITFFNFQEEHFLGDKTRLFELLRLIENDSSLYGKIGWNAAIRASDISEKFVDAEVLKRIRKCGGDGFGVGGESGSDRVLKGLRKGILRKDIVRATKFCNEAQVKLGFAFVMLWPPEKFEDMVETARLICEMYESGPYASVPFFQTYRPYPGSIWESDISGYGNPEAIPDEMWKFQDVASIRTMNIDKPELTYRLVSTTQCLCLAGLLKYRKELKHLFACIAARLLYRLCSWRIKTLRFGYYWEEPILSYLRKKYINT